MTVETISESKSRVCGRPTRSGAPCRAPVHGSVVACHLHVTETETAASEAYWDGWSAGHLSGLESAQSQIQQYKDEIARLYDMRKRLTTHRGAQIVEVNNYAYSWLGDEPLQIGDVVVLPPSWVSNDEWIGTVTGIGTLRVGDLRPVRRRASDDV
jgi:hypothetical protein